MVRTVQAARPKPEVNKPAITTRARHKGFFPLPVSSAPIIERVSVESSMWFPEVTGFFKDGWHDLSEIWKEASTSGQGMMDMAVQELTEVSREVSSFSQEIVSDLKDTTMQLRELSMDAPEQLQEHSKNYSNDLSDVIRNLLPTTMDCTSGCCNVDEQLEIIVPCKEEHVGGSKETSPQAAVTLQAAPCTRWATAVSYAKVPCAEADEDFTKPAGLCQNGNGATVTTSHHQESRDAASEELAQDKFGGARPWVSFLDQERSHQSGKDEMGLPTERSHQSSSTRAASTRAVETPSPSVRGTSPPWSPVRGRSPPWSPEQISPDPRNLVVWHNITGSAVSSCESIDTDKALSAFMPL